MKYFMVKKLKAVLCISALLLIYSSGNNCGNSYFIWHVPDNCLDQAFKNSQKVIEEIKKHSSLSHRNNDSRIYSKIWAGNTCSKASSFKILL